MTVSETSPRLRMEIASPSEYVLLAGLDRVVL
jgi:hypothetical protein